MERQLEGTCSGEEGRQIRLAVESAFFLFAVDEEGMNEQLSGVVELADGAGREVKFRGRGGRQTPPVSRRMPLLTMVAPA